MESENPVTATVTRGVRIKVYGIGGIAGNIVGDSQVRNNGQLVLELGLSESSGYREIDVTEGDAFEFVGSSWTVSKVFEPPPPADPVHWAERITGGGGSVAILTRITDPTE